jgi:hypothetical protein
MAAVALASLSTAIALFHVPPLSECRSEPSAEAKRHWFRAKQTVVQPWLGPHNVYGIFSIPKRFKFHHLYATTLTIDGIASEVIAGSPENEDKYFGTPDVGYYFKRVDFSTRTALWLLLTGRFGDLRASCHWWLLIAERER